MAFGLTVSAMGFWVELRRARAGHELAWAYVLEWPLIAGMCLALWWRLRAELRPGRGRATGAGHGGDHPAGAGPGRARRPGIRPGICPGIRPGRLAPRPPTIAPDDPHLLAWQAYLDRLHAEDPPGGPPPRPAA
jgi:hypothetical protein